MLRKSAWVVLLGLFVSVGSVVPSHARRHRDNCDQKIRKAQYNVEMAIRKHGEGSRQAAQKRRKLERVHAKCRNRM
jgi:uncharacterized protein HemY